MDYRSIIESKYNRTNWQGLLYDIFRQRVQFWQQPQSVQVDESIAKRALYTGKITLPDGHIIAIYEVELSDSVVIERNRTGIRNLLCANWRGMGGSGAFMFCFRQNEAVLRFSYVSETFAFSEDGSLTKESTDTKRFTYLLGEGHRSRTAISQFEKLKASGLSLKDVTKAFSVEALGDLFFKEYKKRYEDIIEFITGKRMVKVANKWEEQVTGQPCREIMQEFSQFPDAEKAVRDYVKKLMGRLVFIQFLQKKGWMGCSAGDAWNDGDKEFVQNLFANTTHKNTFVDDVLEPLFNDINTKRNGDITSSQNVGNGIKIPYLNGGLFEKDDYDKTNFPLPAKYMKSLLDFFASYNFTIDENDPDDAEIGVDPEMLGRIFENLLEDNKDKGAFYTPKEIVQYMCRESLIAYLQTDVNDDQIKDSIRQFVTTYDASLLSEGLKETVDQKLKDVKICDPAIGSGAFPMGLLRELYACRKAIEGIDDETAVSIKTHIIQNNIYGVDIEKGAVDIARLRFWLALIVDEKNPHALPNLDFKIMQGNSLLEQYEGVELSGMSLNEQEKKKSKAKKQDAYQSVMSFEADDALASIQKNISLYYKTDSQAAKKNLRSFIEEDVRNYIKMLKGCTPDIQRKLENLPIPNDQFFLWHIYFKEVFDNGGFDIVIGNPPYIKEYENRKAFDGFREYSPYYIGKMDLWYGFACHGIDMTKPNGILSFIAQNNWTTSAGAKKMRMKIAKDASIIQLLDFNDYMVFEEASIQTMIMFFRHSSCLEEYNFENYSLLDNSTTKDFLALLDKGLSKKTSYKLSVFKRKEIEDKTFVFPEESNIINKIKKDKTFLNPKEVGQGIVPALDDYFLVDNPCEYTSEEQKYIVPFYTGVLDRYSKYPVQKYLIYMSAKNFFGTTLEGFPNLQSHFAPYKDELIEAKTKYGTPNKPYFFVHRERDENFFKPGNEKIVTQVRCEYPKFFYTEESFYGSRALFFIRSNRYNMKFLTGVLNSRIVEYWLRNNGKKQGKLLKLDKEPLLSIPLPLETCNQVSIATLVNHILSAKMSNPLADTSAEEREIDRLVYELYGLTEDEIAIVEGTN